MGKNHISLPAVRDLLSGARMEALTNSADEAVRAWREDFRPHHVALDQTTRARAISNMFYFQVQQSMAEDPGFHYGEFRNQRYIVFDDRLLLRFKLLDQFLESSNFPTQQALDFVHQAQITDFPAFDRLHFGYRLDITGQLLTDAFVTLPTGVEGAFNEWVWQVMGDPITNSGTYGIQLRLLAPGEEPPVLYLYENYGAGSG